MKALFLALMVFVFAGCSSTRKSTKERTEFVSSFRSDIRENNALSSSRILLRDSAFRFPQRKAAATFNVSDFTPLYTPAGKPMPQTFTASGNGITARLTIQTDGTAVLSADADSLLLIVRAIEQRQDSFMRNVSRATTDTVEREMTYTEFFQKSSGWLNIHKGILIGIAIVIALGGFGDKIFSFIYKLFKRK